MRLNSEDRAVLDRIARDGGEIVDRAVAWCAINSGSRHLAGLERQREVLLDAASRLPAAPIETPLSPSAARQSSITRRRWRWSCAPRP